jgi:uncharacterized protein
MPMPDWSRPDFDWDDGNELHLIERHDVYPEEAEQVFFNGAHVRRAGDVYVAYGRDDAGHYLFLVFVIRGTAIRVFSARTMTRDERRFYERYR